MRVLHIIESLDFGGAEKIVVSLANGMADAHDVAICCLKHIGVLGNELDKRIQVFCLDKGEGNDFFLPLHLAALMKKNNFDVVHTHNWAVFLEGGLASILAGVRLLVHTVHGPYTEYPPSWRSRIKLALRHFLERLVSRRFYRIVAVSDAIREYMEKTIHLAAKRLLTIHNGIPATNVQPTERATREYLTFMTVGRLAVIKNHAMMLRAFAEIAKSNAHARLIIVGDGPERAKLENSIKENHLQNKISLLGFRADIDNLLRDADIFLLTSHYEGISIALLEAMRAGLPAIGTHVGGMPEIVRDGHTGILVPADDHVALIKAMTRLAGSKSLRDEMGKQAYAYFIKEFSLTTMLSRYQNLYTKTI